MNYIRRNRLAFQKALFLLACFYVYAVFAPAVPLAAAPEDSVGDNRPIIVITIDGPITPATDDYLKSSLRAAVDRDAKLVVVRLNTPGGVLSSMQTMVASLLDSPVPTVVYVWPGGAGATSAGVFITLAGHVAAMAPGTTIGAAHPVLGSGGDIEGDMREKIENFTVSLITAIAEQRGRNVKWAEQAVRESVSITDRQAQQENVIDLVAADLPTLLAEIEGKTVTVKGKPVTLQHLKGAPLEAIDMDFRQTVISILADPNIAVLLGLAALVGIGIELYHPGAILPGVVGIVCLVLSLIAGQTLPISYGGLGLLLLGVCFFGVEMMMPSFGIWGISGIICLVLGSIYFLDSNMIWSSKEFSVNKIMVGIVAGLAGLLLMVVCYFAVDARGRKVTTGKEGLIGKEGVVKEDFTLNEASGRTTGRIEVAGEIWNARCEGRLPKKGERVSVKAMESGMVLFVS